MENSRAVSEALKAYPKLDAAVAEADINESMLMPPDEPSNNESQEGERFYLTDQLDGLDSLSSESSEDSDPEEEIVNRCYPNQLDIHGEEYDDNRDSDPIEDLSRDDDDQGVEDESEYEVSFNSTNPIIDLSDVRYPVRQMILAQMSEALDRIQRSPRVKYIVVMSGDVIEFIPIEEPVSAPPPFTPADHTSTSLDMVPEASSPESEEIPSVPDPGELLRKVFYLPHKKGGDPLKTSCVELFGSLSMAAEAFDNGAMSFRELVELGLKQRGVFNRIRIEYDIMPVFTA
ncbi:phosphoprotein [Vesiculovirus bogdanovac]|uniref:Phosphoprotein n=1 Tax=Vesiculovirus bogdanovac TaxID=1972567 RepID=K4FFQ0_9RHAB|nr:phosphoprotein [Vesiculovirus bogdanovac]AFH89677.1 phosphoprotein [Vesiculovirus bogdanovac]